MEPQGARKGPKELCAAPGGGRVLSGAGRGSRELDGAPGR